MAFLELDGLTKRHRAPTVVKGVALSVDREKRRIMVGSVLPASRRIAYAGHRYQ